MALAQNDEPNDKPNAKPIVIGLYGIPGAGKSALKDKLKVELGETQFNFHEGSEVIASLVPGGLAAFQQASEEEKTQWRQAAITDIQGQANRSGRAAIVTGHYMFWSEGKTVGQAVLTKSDLDIYTHIVYLKPSPDTIAVWRQLDQRRTRVSVSVQHLRTWQDAEVTELRQICRDAGIMFAPLSGPPDAARVAALLLDFQKHDEHHNLSHAQRKLDEIISARQHSQNLHTALVLDADRTLAAQDASNLFWSHIAKAGGVWEAVLAKAGYSDNVKVLGGGRISDGFVVTAKVKGDLIAHMRDTHSLYVWTVGDSPLDLPMMHQAHQAIVVVGDEEARSKTMDKSLLEAMDQIGLRAHQALLPKDAAPRLDTEKLPIIQLTELDSLKAVSRRRGLNDRVVHATSRAAAKLLMTPTRDATVAGPALRAAHRRIGWYLATDFLSEVLGVEEYKIPHVQGHATSGHRIWQEARTTIVALMRGGEPMALGVNDVLPQAMFVHAKQPSDLQLPHLKGQWAVLLVDSVINNGKSMVEFVDRIRSLDATVSIVAVAGVVQENALSAEGLLGQAMRKDRALSLVALRLSRNKFTGQGTTDTGNRLFNTTQML